MVKSKWTLSRIYELFPRLYERRSNGGHELSGGEQQMLSIKRALMTNPELLLIDEATEGLAPLAAKDIWKTLGVVRDEGIAGIVVDKDYRSLSHIADRLVVMSKGNVVFDDKPSGAHRDPGSARQASRSLRLDQQQRGIRLQEQRPQAAPFAEGRSASRNRNQRPRGYPVRQRLRPITRECCRQQSRGEEQQP